MRKIHVLFYSLTFFPVVGHAEGEKRKITQTEIIRIEIDDASDRIPDMQDRRKSDYTKLNAQQIKELYRRVYRLEMAVVQLQEQVFQLSKSTKPKDPDTNQQMWTCMLTDSFKKTFSAKSSSETESRALVIQKCQTENSFGCEESKVKCGL
ncbi:MAG: hypothetical protein RL189_3022 [Pseudomonadota bacterium]|jgi:Mg2+ and Co2+ transporter CorA